MKNILITGGAGFIGSHVVKRFVNKYPNYNIYNVDNLNSVGNLSFVKISPLIRKSDYEKIIVTFKNSVINKIEIFYRIGRIIEIKFNMVQINLKLEDSDFELDISPNVEVEKIN